MKNKKAYTVLTISVLFLLISKKLDGHYSTIAGFMNISMLIWSIFLFDKENAKYFLFTMIAGLLFVAVYTFLVLSHLI